MGIDKSGLQHVEFVLSFVIFVGFLIFALYFFSPFSGDRVVESALFYAMDEVKNDVGIELETFSISVDENVGSIVGINLNVLEIYNSRVVDSSGNVLNSYFDGSNVFIDKGGNDFFVVELSEDFVANVPFGDGILNPDNYTISSSDKRMVLSENRFADLAQRYNSDYSRVKEEFNLPERGDFAFSLIFSEGDEIITDQSVPEGLEVFSDSKRFETIRTSGNIEFANLVVKVW